MATLFQNEFVIALASLRRQSNFFDITSGRGGIPSQGDWRLIEIPRCYEHFTVRSIY